MYTTEMTEGAYDLARQAGGEHGSGGIIWLERSRLRLDTPGSAFVQGRHD